MPAMMPAGRCPGAAPTRACPDFPAAETLVVRDTPVVAPVRHDPGAGRVVPSFAGTGFDAADAPDAARAVVAYTEVAVFARAMGTGAFEAAPLEETPAPARRGTFASSLVEGALAGRAIWDAV